MQQYETASANAADKENFAITLADRIKSGRRRPNTSATPNQQVKRPETGRPNVQVSVNNIDTRLSSPLKRQQEPEDDSRRVAKRPCPPPRILRDDAQSRVLNQDPPANYRTATTASSETHHSISLAHTPRLATAVVSPPLSDAAVSDDTEVSTPLVAASSENHAAEDESFIKHVTDMLEIRSKSKTNNIVRRQARRILELLQMVTPPTDADALFLSGTEAKERLRAENTFFSGPIITKDQQPLPLQTTTQFLDECYDDAIKVWIQDSSARVGQAASQTRQVTLARLKQRLSNPNPKDKAPWNCLELATHVEDGLRPAFLNDEDCRLLTKLKHPSANDQASRRGYEPGWKEVEKWALLAQAGALTEPHQDSHGYSTYITVNQGVIGFGWLANPTAAERKAWRIKPGTFTGGQWRYVVLRPGQTVYFPGGTVHFVFRLPSEGDTLAFGGHVLRCSQIVRWVTTLLEEKAAPGVTNEDITVSAPAYLERVARFVKQAQQSGQEDKWGGEEAIEEFLRLKEQFVKGP